MMSLSRLGQIFSGASSKVPLPKMSCDDPCGDPYEDAADMLTHLEDYLSAEFKADPSLRLYGAFYLADLKGRHHAIWKDYAQGAIGDKELAFIVDVAARRSKSSLEAQLGYCFLPS